MDEEKEDKRGGKGDAQGGSRQSCHEIFRLNTFSTTISNVKSNKSFLLSKYQPGYNGFFSQKDSHTENSKTNLQNSYKIM